MGAIFDRNVHPLYTVMAFISAVIVVLLLISGTHNRKGIEKNHKLIFLWVMFFCLQDGIWGLFASHIIYNDTGLFAVSNVFHLSAILSAFAWTLYFLSRINIKTGQKKLYLTFAGIFVIIQVCMVIANLFTHFMFYVDEYGWYQTTDYRAIMFYLQFATYIFIGIVSLLGTAREQNNRRGSLSVIFFVNLSPLLFGVFQLIYPDAPADSIGFAIGCVIIELFLSREYEQQVFSLEQMQEQLQESLTFTNFFLNQFVSAYYVNLEDLSCRVYKRTDALDKGYPIMDDYFYSLKNYINEAVHKDDKAELLSLLNPDSIKLALRETNSFTNVFRDISLGEEKIYKVQVIRGADKYHAAFGFEDVTEEYLEQQSHLLGAIPLSSDVLIKANIGLWSFELDEGCEPRMYADEAMLKLIGLDHQVSPEETYHAWYDNIDDASYDLVADAVAKMTSGEHAEVQYPWHNPNGETWIVRCGGVRNFEYKKGIRIEGTHQNVTELLHYDEEERKREERRREDELARVRAEASSKAKTEFLFNMSHDIRTPMNAILGYTDIAMNHIGEPDKVNDSLKKIRLSGGHLLNLINDILEMSRIEAGKMEIVSAPVNVYESSEGVITMSRSLAATKSIAFNVETVDFKNPYIYSDELHVNQVLINLISNAIKYTNPGGTVEYKVEQVGDPVEGTVIYRMTVKDNGIGMSEDFQKHLFESFSREQSATVSKQEGAGLGLAIVKKIVDMIGGTITVQSKLGVGSTFTVELPFKVMDEKAIEEFEASRKKDTVSFDDYSFDGKKVLLVEDNEMNREIATEILEEVGLVTDTAEDGAIAVKTVAEKGTGYYDFILMDIQMPVMDGYEATAEIRKLPDGHEVPIVALSANAFKEDIERSLAAGMNAHVSKPIDIKELFDTLKMLK